MKFLTLWLPAACAIGAMINSFVPIPFFYEELGIIENLTVIFLLWALIALAVYAFKHFKTLRPLDKALVVVMMLGSIYFAGEELSWGQHLAGFETPESIREKNYQNEMNLHNTEGIVGDLLDKIPRNLLTVGIFVGGIVFPFIRRKLPAWVERYVPGKEIVFVSVLAVFISVPPKLFKMAGLQPERTAAEGREKFLEARFDGGEMKEMYIALFILLFALNWLRMVRNERLESREV
jgi:hypothetical protein